MEMNNPDLEQPEAFMDQMKINSIQQLARPTISVLGVGGAGSNIVSWIKQKGITGAKLIAANTDAAHLAITKADRRILIGEKLTQGRGCGGYPERGMEAAAETSRNSKEKQQAQTSCSSAQD